jgi:hypothetical protein
MDYNHTQKAPLHWILLVVALGFAGAAIAFADEQIVLWTTIPVSALIFFLARCFICLNVSAQKEFLSVRFGPIPLFGTTIPYAEIQSVEVAKSTVLDGWGVHWMPGRGWIFNLWGFHCIEVTLKDRTVRIGTDDIEGLLEFLKTKIST